MHAWKFTNELGNEIEAAVEVDGDRVRIVIAGPDSVAENTVTRREAEVLLALLRLALPAEPA